MKCTSTSYIWAFDLGIRSIGEAIRQTTTDQNGQPQTQILHAASLLIPEKLASITDARTKRRAFRTRLAHKAREAWLDFLWQRAGLIPLRKRIPFQDNQTKKWIPELCQKADYRLEREFPPCRLLPSGKAKDGAPAATEADLAICYNSALLRIKLLRGEKLEEWQIYKALRAALQNRGQQTVPWIAREAARTGKTPKELLEEEKKAFEKEEKKAFENKDPDYQSALTKWQQFCQLDPIKNNPSLQYPCYYDAYKIGLWDPAQPDSFKNKPDHNASSTQQVVFPGDRIEAELLLLAQNAATQLPVLDHAYKKVIEEFLNDRRARIEKINQKRAARAQARNQSPRLLSTENLPHAKNFAELFVYGPAGKPNLPNGYRNIALTDASIARALVLRPGTDFDHQSAIGQKIPRFDNRILAHCALFPRLHVCKATPRIYPDNSVDADSLLPCEVTFLFKLKNLRVSRAGQVTSLTPQQIQTIFHHVRNTALSQLGAAQKPSAKAIASKFSLTKTELTKWGKKPGMAFSLLPTQQEIEKPKFSGRSRFSKPALKIIKEIILSGKFPQKIAQELKAPNSPLAQQLQLKISPQSPMQGLTHHDLDILTKCGDSWDNFHIPDTTIDFLLSTSQNSSYPNQSDKDTLIKKYIATSNNPIIRHRLELFYNRLRLHLKKYGKPDFIALEFVREDFLSEEAKKKIQKIQNENKKLNSQAAEKVEELNLAGRQSILKYKLWQLQGGICLYTGKPIGETDIESHEIEHIVPRNHPQTQGPDAQWNLVLTAREINDRKANRTPFEWFQQDPIAFQWPMGHPNASISSQEKQRLWEAYCNRIKQRKKYLGNKRVKLLLSDKAPELVERYEALATTATIARMALRITDILFDWQNGNDAQGNKRVRVFPGGRTAAIRRRYLLNTLLGADSDQKLKAITDLQSEISQIKSQWPSLQGEEHKPTRKAYYQKRRQLAELIEGTKKDRTDDRHHALDAMVLTFLPTWVQDPNKDEFFRFPPPLDNPYPQKPDILKVHQFFRDALNNVIPTPLVFEKARLTDTAYGFRIINNKKKIAQRVSVRKLAYPGQEQKFDLNYLKKQITFIADEKIRSLLSEIYNNIKSLSQQEAEQRWNNACDQLRLKTRNGSPGPFIKKVTQITDFHPEYKDLSKDGTGAYYKGEESHQGQLIYQDAPGEFTVHPIYVHESIPQVKKALIEQHKTICIFVNSGCLVKTAQPIDPANYRKIIYENNKPKRITPEHPLPSGIYKWRTINASSTSVTLENVFGEEFAINFCHLCKAGIQRL